jgi:uncharacterized protein
MRVLHASCFMLHLLYKHMLKEKIESDYVVAMKAKDAQKVSTLRMLRAAVKNSEIDKMKKFDTDAEVEAVVKGEVKKLRETLETATAAGRTEMATQAEEELKILTGYLPEQMDEATVKSVVAETIKEFGPVTIKEMGRVTGEVMRVLKGKADGGLVAKVVKELLTEK